MIMTLSVHQFDSVFLKAAWRSLGSIMCAVCAICCGRLEFGFAVIAFERKELLGGHALTLLPFHR
jgi:hypothetical protein